MEIKILRQLFQEGVILSPRIISVEQTGDGWLLVMQKSSGGAVAVFKSNKKVKKIYKSVRGALADAKEIGFKEAIVELDYF